MFTVYDKVTGERHYTFVTKEDAKNYKEHAAGTVALVVYYENMLDGIELTEKAQEETYIEALKTLEIREE